MQSYEAVYVGNIVTASFIPLKGRIATITDTRELETSKGKMFIVWATFNDQDLGRWANNLHWFEHSEFNKHLEYKDQAFKEESQTYEAGWYFRDETGSLHGPYLTVDTAQQEFTRYAINNLGEKK